MIQLDRFDQQVRENLTKLDALPDFAADRLWLTFYLMGPPNDLSEVGETLNASGWVNVGGAEGAFLYPKIQIEKSFEAVVRIFETTHELCSRHKVDILNIDADSSADAECSSFVTLYRS